MQPRYFDPPAPSSWSWVNNSSTVPSGKARIWTLGTVSADAGDPFFDYAAMLFERRQVGVDRQPRLRLRLQRRARIRGSLRPRPAIPECG